MLKTLSSTLRALNIVKLLVVLNESFYLLVWQIKPSQAKSKYLDTHSKYLQKKRKTKAASSSIRFLMFKPTARQWSV